MTLKDFISESGLTHDEIIHEIERLKKEEQEKEKEKAKEEYNITRNRALSALADWSVAFNKVYGDGNMTKTQALTNAEKVFASVEGKNLTKYNVYSDLDDFLKKHGW